MTSPSAPQPSRPSGIRFALEGIDEITFHKVLRDLMKDPAFARPLQVQAQPPRPLSADPEDAASLTLVFGPEDRELAVAAMQRLKTIMLRYGVQIDTVWTPSGQVGAGGRTPDAER
ncbi:hypothetical protein [Deinococcus sp.]|uniref:hypothetical protein n=1 Tax=Deinococcus sp. TaxID=47478 RepID=UPI003C7D8053